MNLKLDLYRSIPGLKLPDPLPPVPQIIARMQTVIAETETVHRKYIGADVNKLTDDQLEEAATAKCRLSTLQLRLDQLLSAYPQYGVQASACQAPLTPIPATATTEEIATSTPPSVPTIDNQQTPSEPDPSRSVPDASQPVPQPSQPVPEAFQCDPQSSQSEPSAEANFPLEPELQEMALEVRNLRDKRSPLDHLTDAEHDAIIELLHDYSYAAVARILAKPRPIGLDIQTTDGSLKRFINRRKRNQRWESLARAEKIAQATGPLDGYLKACSFMLESRLLRATTDEQSDPEKIQLLIKSLTALRRQTLAERKQSHREKTAGNS